MPVWIQKKQTYEKNYDVFFVYIKASINYKLEIK
jgi:hypothetical protein